MHARARSFVAIGVAAAACLGPGVKLIHAQQPLRVEGIYPRQLPPAQTTVINLVIPSVDEIQPEISPPQGVTVTSVTRGDNFQGSHTWWAIAVAVANTAAPGDRTLTLRLPGGRATSTAIRVPPHVPQISNLRVLGPTQNAASVDVELTAVDAAADLGEAPYVWFMTACGDMPLPGVVRGRLGGTAAGGSAIRASVPRPPAVDGTAAGACTVQISIDDAMGNGSNTLRTTIESGVFGRPASQEQTPARASDGGAGGGEWAEIISQEERLTLNFPAQPAIAHVSWRSQYGAVLPARVYSTTVRQARYSATVVDYNPVERLLVERSRSCPAAANTCQGIADWGIGYWKTDVRGATLYAIATYLERDARITSLIWNGIALVQGVEMRLTNNADQSRTFVSIYMHENRLVILEATVPRGDPPPVAFNESLNWLDEEGRTVRYQSTYVNIPDVPKPLPRGAPAPAATASR